MIRTLYLFVRIIVRTIVVWVVDALSLLFASLIMPGISIYPVAGTPEWAVVVASALLLAIVNLLIRPIVLLLARPLSWIVMFIFGYLVNAFALWVTAWMLPGFDVTWSGALFGAIIISIFNTILIDILEINEDGSFYQNRIERRAKAAPFDSAAEPGRGLMMVEIDGLSYWHIQKALDDGLMPTLKSMIEEQGYKLSLTDCGLPSMTSACQAGIMFGDNYDIPAYRWYDKSKQKLYVSASDATELNERYAHGNGLMRHGSSLGNMFDGDAEKSMFTMSNLRGGSPEENRRRANDVNLLMLDPYFLTRALAVFLFGIGRELWEAWQQKRHDVQPRLNRMEHWYPIVRSATCTILRDLSANIAIMDMMRGAPSIYMLYLGYDEVAHHSGPWTDDAFGELHRLDETFERLRHVALTKASRPYDLIILSDHGQSFGATFKQRYGMEIKDLIQSLMPAGTEVAQSIGGDTGAVGLSGLAGELNLVSNTEGGTAFDKTMAHQGEKLANRAVESSNLIEMGDPASVTAYGSGNAAQVYFDLFPRKILLSELNAVYPGMIDNLIAHEGIGLVFGYEDDNTVLAIGKNGTRNLHTGEILGTDPLIPYAPESGHGAASIEKRVWQTKRVMEFPSAGDLWVISCVYEDGTVAALEELIGSHGGVGGEQTDAFIFHPPDMEVPETHSSMDVFHILDGHRNAPVIEEPVPDADHAEAADWRLSVLVKGIGQVGQWLTYLVRCLFVDRSAYEAVARNPYMTGPALLVSLYAAIMGSSLYTGELTILHGLASYGVWLLSVLGLYLAGRWLTKEGSFTDTFRAVGFAQAPYLFAPFVFLPVFGPVVRFLIVLFALINTWVGAAAAHRTSGWRTILLPIVAILILFIGYIVIGMLFTGTEFAFNTLAARFGFVQQP